MEAIKVSPNSRVQNWLVPKWEGSIMSHRSKCEGQLHEVARGKNRRRSRILEAPKTNSILKKETPRVNCIICDGLITPGFFDSLCHVWESTWGCKSKLPLPFLAWVEVSHSFFCVDWSRVVIVHSTLLSTLHYCPLYISALLNCSFPGPFAKDSSFFCMFCLCPWAFLCYWCFQLHV